MFCEKKRTQEKTFARRLCIVGIMAGSILMLGGCLGSPEGNHEEEQGQTEWEGPQADLEKGLYVKEAVYYYTEDYFPNESLPDDFHTISIYYGVDGSIIGVQDGNGNGGVDCEPVEQILDIGTWRYGYEFDKPNAFDFAWTPYYYKVTKPAAHKTYLTNTSLESEDRTYTFDRDGKVTCLTEGDVQVLYTYDAKGRLCKTKTTGYREDQDGNRVQINSSESIVYQGLEGRVVEYSKVFSDGSTLTYRWEYDDNGNLTKETCKSASTSWTEWEYDSNNNLTRYSHYGPGNDLKTGLLCLVEWEYDDNGNLTSQTATKAHGQGDAYYEETRIALYNTDGRVVEESIHIVDAQGKEYLSSKKIWEYQYDKEGRVIETNLYEFFGMDYYGDNGSGNYRWHKGAGMTPEPYLTEKVQYLYEDDGTMTQTITRYTYEANADYSVVNLLETEEQTWRYGLNYGYWVISYYTEQEVEEYLHDQEFKKVN